MGGYGSTRWGWARTRQDTDPLLWLDVRILHRQGALKPGAVSAQAWTRGGKPSGDIGTRMSGDGETLTLIYRTQRRGQEWRDVCDPIELDWTPCNYGGERPWFTCPGCRRRRAVLFSVDGRFRCKACHDLAYSSTRESESDRSIRRADKLRKRMGDTSTGPVWRMPTGPRPAGMSWRTYWRLWRELAQEIDRMSDLLNAELEVLLRRTDKLTGA